MVVGSAVAGPVSDDGIVAVVNGTEIRESDVALADVDIGRGIPTQDKAQRREQIIAHLTDSILLAKAAQEQNVADSAEIDRHVAYARRKFLMIKLMSVTAERAATDEAVRKIYRDTVAKTPSQPELHLRSLVFYVRDAGDTAAMTKAEDLAKTALKRIQGGEDFAAVVADMSEDPVARSIGGDRGYLTQTEMGKEYAEVAFALANGGVSQPVKTNFGWHVIKVEDKRDRKPLDFDLARDKLAGVAARMAQVELLNKLRAEAKIERRDRQPAQAAGDPAK